MKRLLIFTLFSFLSSLALAQGEVKLIARPKGKNILLRWAPTNPEVWSLANKNGYYVERFTIADGQTVLRNPTRVNLTPSPLKPSPLEQWKNEATRNSNAAIAAQALFGKTFEATITQSRGLADVINKTRELEQRFSFALFAADHSFETALLSGLALTDSTVRKNERYLYRVFVAASPNAKPTLKIDSGIFYVGLRDSVGLAPPANLRAQFADRVVLLQWPRFLVEKQYTSFVIERAEAQKGEFVRTRQQPYINTSDSSAFFQAMDSLPQNGIEYQYRIRGITPFGETGPESERVSGSGFKAMTAKAVIADIKPEQGNVVLTWTVSGDPAIAKAFDIQRAASATGAFSIINKERIAGSVRTYTDRSPLSTGYYRIRTYGERGQEATSFERLIQLPDSVPPMQPKELVAKIDTTGKARLSWRANTESDLLGYRVYRSNFRDAEFSLINTAMSASPSYIDSINIRRLDKKIYYRVVALDRRMNPSPYSDVVEAAIPDIIAPAAPSIRQARSTSDGIFITWNASASNDVKSYQIIRKPRDSANWRLLKVLELRDTIFNDKTANSGTQYAYSLVAVDEAGNKSERSPAATVRGWKRTTRPAITEIVAEADRTNKLIIVHWKFGGEGVLKYAVYRGAGDDPITLYGTVSSLTSGFTDRGVSIGTKYRYYVKIIFNDGTEGVLSKGIEITY